MKMVIEIPDKMYKTVQDGTYCGSLYEELKNGIPVEQCGDCISREAVMHILDEVGGDFDSPREAVVPIDYIADMVSELPSVTAQPKTGRLILLDECSNSGYYCSECHKKVVKEGCSNTVKKIKYCPNCGAKMQEVGNGCI